MTWGRVTADHGSPLIPGYMKAAQHKILPYTAPTSDFCASHRQAVLRFDSAAQQQLAAVEAGLKAAETSFRRVKSFVYETLWKLQNHNIQIKPDACAASSPLVWLLPPTS